MTLALSRRRQARILGVALSLAFLPANVHSQAGKEEAAPAYHAPDILELVVNQVAQLKTLDITYDFTASGGPLAVRYQRRRSVFDYASGRYLIKSVSFKDAKHTAPTAYHLFAWDGAKQTEWVAPLDENEVKDGMIPNFRNVASPGVATVNANSSVSDIFRYTSYDLGDSIPLWQDLQNNREGATLSFEKEGLLLKTAGYEVLLDQTTLLPSRLEMFGDTGSGRRVIRRLEMSGYRKTDNISFPSTIVVSLFGEDMAPPTALYRADIVSEGLKVNTPITSELDSFKVPVGALVKDYVANKMYRNDKVDGSDVGQVRKRLEKLLEKTGPPK